MPRLRNVKTGAVVNVDDELAKALDGYEPVEVEKKAPAKKPASKKSE